MVCVVCMCVYVVCVYVYGVHVGGVVFMCVCVCMWHTHMQCVRVAHPECVEKPWSLHPPLPPFTPHISEQACACPGSGSGAGCTEKKGAHCPEDPHSHVG